MAALAAAGTVAVLLPGAFLTLRETQAPPVEALRQANVPMAVASDCNPGTSPMPSMLAAIHLACAQFRLTPEEALAGATRHAARALGLELEAGTLEAGKAADIAVWDVERPAELAYWLGKPMLHKAYCRRGAERVITETEALIIGGGHNGLVCAFYLARAGLKVTVLERRHVVGGAAVTEEFHPGFPQLHGQLHRLPAQSQGHPPTWSWPATA